MNKNICTFIGCDKTFDNANTVIFGAPFDGTTSYHPGTRFAPSTMRNESYAIETYSPYLDLDLEDKAIFDAGDLSFPLGNADKVLKVITSFTKKLLSKNKKPVMIGGEHLVTYATVKAMLDKYSNLVIVHLDAHADLRDDYLGEKLSHACVMKRIWDLVGDNKIYQYGIRSGEQKEFEFAKTHTTITKFNLNGFKELATKLKDTPVYFTLDLDVLDPSIFPGTGTPEAGGVSFNELLECVHFLKNLNIVGADINELSPTYDQSGVSTLVACKILRELLLVI